MNGASGGTRTPNLLIRSQKLYPIELRMRRGNVDFELLANAGLARLLKRPCGFKMAAGIAGNV